MMYPTRESTMAFDNNRDQIVNRERAISRRSETAETGCKCRIRRLEIVLMAVLQQCRLSIFTSINFTPIHFVLRVLLQGASAISYRGAVSFRTRARSPFAWKILIWKIESRLSAWFELFRVWNKTVVNFREVVSPFLPAQRRRWMVLSEEK